MIKFFSEENPFGVVGSFINGAEKGCSAILRKPKERQKARDNSHSAEDTLLGADRKKLSYYVFHKAETFDVCKGGFHCER